MHLNPIDIAILAVLLVFTLRGILKGLIGEVMGFVAVLLSLVLAVRWLNLGTTLLLSIVEMSPALAMLISFVLIFALVFLGTFLLARMLRKLLQITMLGWVDRLGGGAFGLLTGSVIVSLLVLLVSFIPLNQTYRQYEKDSILFRPAQQFAPKLFNWVAAVAPSAGDFYQEVSQAVSSKTRSISGPLQEFLHSVQKNADKKSPQNGANQP